MQQSLHAQCSPSDFQQVFIDPDSVIIARLIVENATLNDLSDPSQGVCGVSIDFKHNSIKELEIRLISPSGQSVDLIGPISPDGSITFNPQWDISFLACTEAVNPDPGFSNPWTNTDNWAGPQTYTGSYHPYQGCLDEAFDTGPVNGLWSLEILNSSRFDDGELFSFELEFCDNTFDCNQCIPTPGSFDPLGLPEDYCAGSTELVFDFSTLVDNNPPGYGYQFYVLQEDNILEVVDIPDLTSYDVGSYRICGLSYYQNQEANLIVESSFEILNETYKSAQSPVCAKFTDNCFTLNIVDYTDTLTIDTTICEGGDFGFNGVAYTTQGLYQDRLGSGLCDTLVLIDLKTVELEALISNDSDLITCDNDRIELSSEFSTSTQNTVISWRTPDGSIEGDVTSNSVFATQAGRYWLVLSEGTCKDSFSIDIAVDTDVPNLEVSVSDTLDCINNTVNLIVNSNPAAIEYQWTGPQENLPDDVNIPVSMPGIYTVSVTLPTGCSTSISTEVFGSFAEPSFEIAATDISCNDRIGTVQILSADDNLVFDYQDGLLNENTNLVEYASQGNYTISATSLENGCESDTTFLLSENTDIPMLNFEPVVNLSCSSTSIELIVNADIPISSYIWEGPGGTITTTEENKLTVNTPGEYLVFALGENGCGNDLTQLVNSDGTDLPSISLSAETITCATTSVEINVTSNESGIDYEWTSDFGFSSNLQNPRITQGGKYYLTATVSPSCEVFDSIVILEDTSLPELFASAQPITCERLESALTIDNEETSVNYSWLDSDGNSLVGLNPTVNNPGEFRLEAIGSNGCSNALSVVVDLDTISPVAMAIAPLDLLCDRTQVNLNGDGSSVGERFSYTWSTADGSILADGNTLSPIAGAPGNYRLVVTDSNNGCIAEATTSLQETRSDITSFEFEKLDPPCASVPRGSISITDVVGGESPYTYSVDGINFQADSNFDMLTAQLYTVTVKDDFGCKVSENVIIEDGLEVSVELEDIYEINLGDQLEIESMLNTNGDPLRSIDWDLENQTVATGSEVVMVRPLQSATIEVSILTESGCMSSTTALIQVTKDKDIYAPNTISVTDFGENGAFKVYPSQAIQEIIAIDIYDRWGNKVFNAERHDPHIESKAWDGTHKSQNLTPGIYVYLIEVLLIDGEQRVIPGEVLLVR